MPFDPQKHHRHTTRLQGYDYARAGAYFVTLCTHQRELFFDHPEICAVAESCWLAIPNHHPLVALDSWVVMPNHLHGVLFLDEEPPTLGRGVQLNAPTTDAPTTRAPTKRDPNKFASLISPHRHSLSVIIRTYKAAVTSACRKIDHAEFAWQRNYHEHVIRIEDELHTTRRYIENNPLQWALDNDNPLHNPNTTPIDYLNEALKNS